MHPSTQSRLIFWPALHNLTGLSRSTVHRMQRAGNFPSSIKVSAHRVAWYLVDITDWLASRPRTGAL